LTLLAAEPADAGPVPRAIPIATATAPTRAAAASGFFTTES